jgi:hypothetical protein
MRVKIRFLFAGELGTYAPGSTLDFLPDAMARALIANGDAELVEDPAAPESAARAPAVEKATLPAAAKKK